MYSFVNFILHNIYPFYLWFISFTKIISYWIININFTRTLFLQLIYLVFKSLLLWFHIVLTYWSFKFTSLANIIEYKNKTNIYWILLNTICTFCNFPLCLRWIILSANCSFPITNTILKRFICFKVPSTQGFYHCIFITNWYHILF